MDAKGRPSSAGAPESQELAELAKLAARRQARPPSAGQKKDGTLPCAGKLEQLDRGPDVACRSNSAPSKRLGRSRSGRSGQRQGLSRASSSGKMGSSSMKAMGFVQKIRAAWGECKDIPEDGQPTRSGSKTQSKKSGMRRATNNWTVLSCFEDSLSLDMEGIWWEWQWWSPSGWSFFSSWVTEQIEKAFALGKSSCSLLHDGKQLQFDLQTGREVNGLGRIRRIRMPCDETLGHGVSVCSTFLATEREGHGSSSSASTWGESWSLWNSGLGESIQGQAEEPAVPLASPVAAKPAAKPAAPRSDHGAQRIVHDTTVVGFSAGWSVDPAASHKPGRHGSRVKHRPARAPPAVTCISLKDINGTPLTSGDHVHHVWREEAYAALNRAGKLADPTQ